MTPRLSCLLLFLSWTISVAEAETPARQSGLLALEQEALAAAVSLHSPALTLREGTLEWGALSVQAVDGNLLETGHCRILYEPHALKQNITIQMALHLTWSAEEGVLRKWAEIDAANGPAPLLLEAVLLEKLDAAALVEPPRFIPPRSYPVFLPGLFVGMEYPAADTHQEDQTICIGHAPEIALAPGTPYVTRTAVYGVAEPGREREAFHRYIAAHRPQPRGMHFNYNSWWTSPVPFSEQDILELMRVFKECLYEPHHAALDSFTIDMGWSNPKSIWEIDPALFPEGFSRIRRGAEEMGARLGLWISPSSFYPPALDPEWATQQGYDSFKIPWGNSTAHILSLGGNRYAPAFAAQLTRLVGEFGIGQVKLDGYYLGSGRQAGPHNVEAAVAGGIAAFDAVRKVMPNVWLECTFDANASPWWLFHANSIIGGYGDDAPYGRVPAPVHRESYTTARDYYNLQSAERLPSPIAAQEILGIIHQSNDDFMNDAVTTVMRGHAFISLYVNPKYMTEPRWGRLAGLLHWARANEDILVGMPTHVLLPEPWRQNGAPWAAHDAPMPRNPYGYAHSAGETALVLLRNPWVAPQSHTLRPEDIPTFRPAAALNVVSRYPEARQYAQAQAWQDGITIPLAPYETLVLALNPAAPPETLPQAEACIRNRIALDACQYELTRVQFEAAETGLGPDWTDVSGNADALLELRLEGQATIQAPQARLLILAEGKSACPDLTGSVQANGADAVVRTLRSDQGFAASGLPPQEHWTFLEADLPSGPVQLTLTAQIPCADASASETLVGLSAWLWATQPGGAKTNDPDALPMPEEISLDAAPVLPADILAQPSRTATRPRQLRRINGVYLDALEPVSQRQGWGTLQKNQSVWERPMTIGDARYVRGLGVHAPSEVVYALDGAYGAFEAWVGPDGANHGTLAFEVLVDGISKWTSGTMTRADAPRRVQVDIRGASTLTLIVSDGGDDMMGDHANWAEACVLR